MFVVTSSSFPPPRDVSLSEVGSVQAGLRWTPPVLCGPIGKPKNQLIGSVYYDFSTGIVLHQLQLFTTNVQLMVCRCSAHLANLRI